MFYAMIFVIVLLIVRYNWFLHQHEQRIEAQKAVTRRYIGRQRDLYASCMAKKCHPSIIPIRERVAKLHYLNMSCANRYLQEN